jgi:cholesterol transport system auxiliary component
MAAAALTLMTACSALKPAPVAPPAFFALDGGNVAARPAPREVSTGSAASAPTLLINPPQAGAGFDSQRIIYVRQAHQLEYFAHSEWVDTPARMLAPLIVSALDRAGTFRAVVATPTVASADLRLDTEIVRLQHEFGSAPSRVRLTLRATLIDNATRQILAQVDLDNRADAASEDAYGGVVAANHATRVMLQTLAVFCGQVVEQWQARESMPAGRAVRRP